MKLYITIPINPGIFPRDHYLDLCVDVDVNDDGDEMEINWAKDRKGNDYHGKLDMDDLWRAYREALAEGHQALIDHMQELREAR